jgi:hypothetical protein
LTQTGSKGLVVGVVQVLLHARKDKAALLGKQ